MTTHRYHPDPDRGDPANPILWDDCERCDEHATDCLSLDRENLHRLLAVIERGRWDQPPTENERRAERVLWHALLLFERLSGRDWRELMGALT